MSNPTNDTSVSETSYEVGDEMTVEAASNPRKIAIDEHHLELYDPPGSRGCGLKWKCERCMHIFANWELFTREPCIPYKKR